MPTKAPGFFIVDKPGDSFGTTGRLSTDPPQNPKLLSASIQVQGALRTYFQATQLRATIHKNNLVHKKWRPLLLLLFIYRTIEEQPKPPSRRSQRLEWHKKWGRGQPNPPEKPVHLASRLKTWAQSVKRDGITLWFAARHPQAPWYAKALGVLVVAYAL